MSIRILCDTTLVSLPCVDGDPDWWFAENPNVRERAKALCAGCPIRRECLAAALDRREPCGVWGGEIVERGAVVVGKRPRGRPRKNVQDKPGGAHACTSGIQNQRATFAQCTPSKDNCSDGRTARVRNIP